MTRRAAALRPARLVTVLLAVTAALGLVVTEPATGDPEGPATTLPVTTVPTTTVPATTVPPTTAPPTTTEPPATATPEALPVRPDLTLRRVPNGPWLGQGRPAGVVPVTVDAPVRAGQRVTFVFRVRHDSPEPAQILLRGGGRDPRADVAWHVGGQDVTAVVERGDLRVVVGPGAHRDLTLAVTLRRTTADGFSLARILTAEARDGGARDRIRAVVASGQVPTRFHDVGRALGLPRHSHSFDLDAAPVDADDVDDLVLSTHGRVDVLLNHQPGLESAFVGGGAGSDIHGCAVADVNDDTRTDLYCTRGAKNGTIAKSNFLWLQHPDGTFAGGTSEAAAFGIVDRYGRGRTPVFLDLDHRLGPDLFIGNEHPRQDRHRSLNRTFVDSGGTGFTEIDLRMDATVGALCAQAVDQDRNGWDDLLVCGGAGPATVGWHVDQNRLHLFRNLPAPAGGRRLLDVAPRLGIGLNVVEDARLAHLNSDRLIDMVVVTRRSVSVWPGATNGTFGLPVFRAALVAGNAVAIADLDGRRGLDVFVVQGCSGPEASNVDDRLYLDAGPGWGWDQARLPTGVAGCGDTAEALDVDGDGVDDLVVGNGQWSAKGPIQVLTSGRYWG